MKSCSQIFAHLISLLASSRWPSLPEVPGMNSSGILNSCRTIRNKLDDIWGRLFIVTNSSSSSVDVLCHVTFLLLPSRDGVCLFLPLNRSMAMRLALAHGTLAHMALFGSKSTCALEFGLSWLPRKEVWAGLLKNKRMFGEGQRVPPSRHMKPSWISHLKQSIRWLGTPWVTWGGTSRRPA